MRQIFICLAFILIIGGLQAQSLGELTVEKIMRDPKWIGTAPTGINWSADCKTIYFNWNPDKAPADSLYKVTLQNRTPQKVSKKERLSLPSSFGIYNKSFSKMLYEKNGDIFLLDIASGKITQFTNTVDRESGAVFSGDEKKIIYSFDQNLYAREISTGNITQVTDFRKGKKSSSTSLGEQEKWLKQDQLAYMEVIKERNDRQNTNRKLQKEEQPKDLKKFISMISLLTNLVLRLMEILLSTAFQKEQPQKAQLFRIM